MGRGFGRAWEGLRNGCETVGNDGTRFGTSTRGRLDKGYRLDTAVSISSLDLGAEGSRQSSYAIAGRVLNYGGTYGNCDTHDAALTSVIR
jgi:hypothetical protein